MGKYAYDDWDIGVLWSASALRADDEFYAEDELYADDGFYADDDWDSGASQSANALLAEDELYTEGDLDTGVPWSALLWSDERYAEGDWLMGLDAVEDGADPTAAGRQGAGELGGHDMVSIGATPTADRTTPAPPASGPLDAGVQFSARGALGGEQVQRDVELAITLAAAAVTWVGTWAGAEAGAVVDHHPHDLLCGDELEALCPQSGMGLVRCLAARRDEISPRCQRALSSLTAIPALAPLWDRTYDARASADCAPCENFLSILLLMLLVLGCTVARRSATEPTAASVSPTHAATCAELRQDKVHPEMSTPDYCRFNV